MSDLDKVVGLPPASASAQALAPTDSVSEMRTGGPPPSPVPPVPPRAIASANSTRNGAPRTSAGPPQTSKIVTAAVAPATAPPARTMPPQPVAVAKTAKAANQPAANKTVATPARKRKAAPTPAHDMAGLSKEEIKFRKKRTKIITPTYIPEVAIVAVPSGGFANGTVVETELQTGQAVKLTINSSDAAASRTTTQLAIKLDTPALMDSPSARYRVSLRGGRIQWVSRKKLETILRNRRSAAATRNTVVDMRLEMDAMEEQLKKKDEEIAELKLQLENAGVKHTVAPSPRTTPAGTSSSSRMQTDICIQDVCKSQSKVGLNLKQSENIAKSSLRSPRTVAKQAAENAKARLFRTLSGGVLQTRAAPWY